MFTFLNYLIISGCRQGQLGVDKDNILCRHLEVFLKEQTGRYCTKPAAVTLR